MADAGEPMLKNGDKLEPIGEQEGDRLEPIGDCDVTFAAADNQIQIAPKQRITRPQNRGRHLCTLAASLSAGLGSLSLGSVIGYTSPAVPDINSQSGEGEGYFRLSHLEISWVAGIISLGGLLGGPIGGCLADRIGRKSTILYAGAPYCLGWGLIAASTNVYMLCCGRFVTGFCAGIIDVTVPIYISELAEASVRGFFGSTHELCTNFGYLYVFAIGCFLHWNWLAVACMAVPIAMSLSMLYMPESPRWLVTKSRPDQAANVLRWLRGPQADIVDELAEIAENVRETSEHRATWRDLIKPTFYKPQFIIIGLMFFQQFSGYGAIPEYLVDIFNSVGSGWNAYMQTAIFGAVGVVSNLLSAFLVDTSGRRIMLTTSASVMALSVSGLATFFSIKHYVPGFQLELLFWLPTLCLIMFNFGVALGYGPIPFYMASELFPLRARGLAGGIGISSVWIFQFINSLCFPHLIDLVGEHGVYMIMAGFAILGIVFAICFVPETKGKTLEQIEREFEGNNRK